MITKSPLLTFLTLMNLSSQRTLLLIPVLIILLLPLYIIGSFFLTASTPPLGVLAQVVLLGMTTLALPSWIHPRRWPPALAIVCGYLLLFIQSFFLLAAVWHWQVEDIYFYCADCAPFFDFFPPFIHASDIDYYIASEQFVYSLWFIFWSVIFLLPLILGWWCWQRRQVVIRK